ncbi:hypothetical protein ACTWQB_01940 [Piscibacillus sp. B03]|uniref:hypothetical protein n=1 Tax=Piscibacillus sp. B03 TaxID=3457430 RepID=UPI003FCE80C5
MDEKFKKQIESIGSKLIKENELARERLNLHDSTYKSLEHANKVLDKYNSERIAKEQAREQREIQLNQMIEQIADNTAFLPEMVGLIRKNNELNEEMLDLYKEMMNVMKAESKEEAENMVMDVVEKAKNTNDSLNAMSNLMNYGRVLIKLMFPES